MLGGPVIGVWASISRYRGGVLEQLDRGGNPTINPFINPDGEKNLFNSRQPADDVANYLGPWSVILQNAGGYTPSRPRPPPCRCCPTSCTTTGPTRHLPQRPGAHRRRVQPALRLADQRQGPPLRPQAPRRPAGRVPLPRPAQPLARSCLPSPRRRRDGYRRRRGGHGNYQVRRGKVIPRSVREKDFELFRTGRGTTVCLLVSFLPCWPGKASVNPAHPGSGDDRYPDRSHRRRD